MAKMMKPEVEAVRFRGGIDVIATSGPRATLTLSGFNDDTPGNGTITFFDGTKTETVNYLYIGGKISDWYESWYGSSIKSGVATKDGDCSGFRGLGYDDSEGISNGWAKGVFTYDPSYSVDGYSGYIWFVK